MELTPRALNRALLARQLLLERQRIPIPRALERVGCLQTQYAPTAYIGLFSRLAGFERPQLTRALERRMVVQGTLMRVTIHMVSARDYPLLVAGIAEPRRAGWLKAVRRAAELREVERAARRVREALRAGAKSRAELGEGLSSMVWNGVGLWIDLVRVPPSGTWERRRADLYALAEEWLGPYGADVDEGRDHLLRRYLQGFGPATLKDAANWAGVPVPVLAPAVERLRLRHLRADDGTDLLDLPRAPLPPPDSPAPPRFLGTFEALLLVHARRTQVLPEEYRPRVFNTKTPHSAPTFLVDGAVAGSWRVERTKDKAVLALEPFAPLPRRARDELRDEAERFVRWHEDDAISHAVRWS
jgi:hypothetical protein